MWEHFHHQADIGVQGSAKTIDSGVLKIYAIGQNDFYGKDIQCQAMKELTDRTIRPGSES